MGRTAEPFEVSTGNVCLKRRDDAQVLKEFKRFESLTGSRRVEEVLSHPDAEMMQGKHIYRAFTTVVYYGPDFRGVKQIASLGMEAAGKVVITPNKDDPADQRLCDTPMTDSSMQFGGFLVNYFNNPSLEDVLVCGKIEHIEIGGSFSPDAKEWVVYANMTEGGQTEMSWDGHPAGTDWNALPQPSLEKIRAVSPMAHIRAGNYNTPTFLIHGTADDLIPWQQSQGTYEAMVEKGIPVELALVEGARHTSLI